MRPSLVAALPCLPSAASCCCGTSLSDRWKSPTWQIDGHLAALCTPCSHVFFSPLQRSFLAVRNHFLRAQIWACLTAHQSIRLKPTRHLHCWRRPFLNPPPSRVLVASERC